LAGERSGLWFQYARIISEVKPKWVIIENVSALRSRGLDQVLRSLSEIGYDAERHCIPASAVGASIKRERLWVVAFPRRLRRGREQKSLNINYTKNLPDAWKNRTSYLPARPIKSGWDEIPGDLRVAYWVPGWMDRLKQLGNSVVPQIVECIGNAILLADKGGES
jgi:DNA (cytosine-5)-methyltransferase 1